MKKKILYIGAKNSRMPTSGPFVDALHEIGDFTLIEDGSEMPLEERIALVRNSNIVLTMWGSMQVPEEIADDPGDLEYICNITGELRPYVPLKIIEAGIPVTNWGDAPANGVAEGAMVLLFAVMKDLHARIQYGREGGCQLPKDRSFPSGLEGLNLGIYGFGVIGRRFAEMAHVFRPVIRVFDPYITEVPDYCIRVNSLEELFSQSEAVAIHAGLTDETRKSVNAKLLAMLPDHGIIINTARGGIVDQDALFAELESGRLRAGLDVLDGNDRLTKDHPARKWENCIFTYHNISGVSWPERPNSLTTYQKICLDNLRRFINGEPLRFIMDRVRYLRST